MKKGETNREKTRFRGLYALLFDEPRIQPRLASLLIIWFFIILLRTLLISWAGDCASVRDEPKKNLNPYSASSSFGRADKKEETREKEA